MEALIRKLKDWWWLGAGGLGFIVLWGNLPVRVSKVEAGQEAQQEQLTELREISGKLDGYIASQQQMNKLLAERSAPAALSRPSAGGAPHTAPTEHSVFPQATDTAGNCWECPWEDTQGCWTAWDDWTELSEQWWQRCASR